MATVALDATSNAIAAQAICPGYCEANCQTIARLPSLRVFGSASVSFAIGWGLAARPFRLNMPRIRHRCVSQPIEPNRARSVQGGALYRNADVVRCLRMAALAAGERERLRQCGGRVFPEPRKSD